MRRRFLPLLVAFVILCTCMTATAHAAEDDSGLWVELLETATINNSGNNFFTYTTSATINIPLPSRFRVARVDMIFACSNGTIPSTVGVMYNNALTNLTIVKISNSLFRAYGSIVNTFYDSMQVRLIKSGTTSSAVELLSCRVSRIAQESFPCDAEFYIAGDSSYTACPGYHYFTGSDAPETVPGQFPVMVYDWNKYDSITVTGSVESMALNSVRASIGSVGLPYEITYTSSNPTHSTSEYYLWEDVKHYSYDESYKGTIDGSVFTEEVYLGKVLFTVTIDLTGVDRSSTDLLALYFTGVYTANIGYAVQIVGVEGGINVADTTDVTWWTRFTTFMKDLFSRDSSAADDYQAEAGQQRDELDDMNDQLDNVTKPDVDGIQMDIDNYLDGNASQSFFGALGKLTGNNLLISMMCITLTIALVGYILYGKR